MVSHGTGSMVVISPYFFKCLITVSGIRSYALRQAQIFLGNGGYSRNESTLIGRPAEAVGAASGADLALMNWRRLGAASNAANKNAPLPLGKSHLRGASSYANILACMPGRLLNQCKNWLARKGSHPANPVLVITCPKQLVVWALSTRS
jgi:hypothetical protein